MVVMMMLFVFMLQIPMMRSFALLSVPLNVSLRVALMLHGLTRDWEDLWLVSLSLSVCVGECKSRE